MDSGSQASRSCGLGGSEGEGCFGCFGSARIPDDADDEPDEEGLFHVLSDQTRGPYLDDHGKNLVKQMQDLTLNKPVFWAYLG